MTMKKLSVLPILLALMAWTMPDAVGQDFIVSGAGATDVNGSYIETGTYNGKPLYVQDGGPYVIVWTCDMACDGWHISEDFGGLYCCGPYWTEDGGDTPPSTGWQGFPNPVPTVGPEGRTISYGPSFFREAEVNDGSMGNTITITYNGFGGDFLTGSMGEDYIAAGKVIVSNVPAGLTASIELTAANTLTFALNGNASPHTHLERTSELTVTFTDAAFDGGNAADVLGFDRNDLSVLFKHRHTVAASGADHTIIAAALAACIDGDEIEIAAGVYTESGLVVNRNINIYGAGADQTIVQAHAQFDMATNRVFEVADGVDTVRMYDLTIRHGRTSGSGFGSDGGGISVANTHFEMYRCRISRNINRANTARGGGFNLGSQSFHIVDCLLDSNQIVSADRGFGGGLYLFNGNIPSSTSDIVNCTFTANSIQAPTFSIGGGANVSGNRTRFVNCTVTGNSAGQQGGGVNVSVLSNRLFDAINLISVGNISPSGSDFYRADNSGSVSGYNSIIGVSAAQSGPVFNGTSLNISTSDPLLEALADNGGPTFTHAIGVGSPAIGAGTSTGAPTLDQRGYARIGAIDIGAYQANGVPSWTGIVSNIWNNPANWAGGAVPGGDDDAYITSDVIITDDPDAPATCNNLTIVGGANLWVRPGKALTVEGNMTVNGSATLESSATGTGTIITLGTVGGSGTFIAQQYLTGSGGGTPDGRHWYVAPTVGNTNSGAFSAADDNRLWAHDESLEVTGPNGTGWTEITDDVTALSPMRGYLARFGATETVEYSGGVFNTGNLSLTDLSRTGTTNSRRGYQLVANPYPSFLNWDDAYSAGSINLLPTVWYRTEQSGSMVFATYNALLGEGVLGATRDIHPGQAFWVRVDGDGNTGILAVNNDMRSHRDGETLRDGTDLIRLTLTNGTQTDEAMVFFNDLADNGADIYDSEKQMAPAEVPQLWSTVEGARMAINGIHGPETQPSVPLGIRVQNAGEYTITATELDLPVGAWLEDITTGAFQSLDSEPSYAFTSEGGTFQSRFVLHFSAQVVGLDEMASGIDIFSFEKNINIILSEETRGTATVLDIAGRVITTTTLQGQRTTTPLNVSAGIYVVRVETERGVESRKVMVN
jgi:hypothetical protein